MAAVAAVVAAVAAFSPPVAAAGHAGEPPTAEAGSHACGERVVALSEGFNLVGLVAPASPGGFAARAVYGWEAGSQSFASWRAGVPASLNGLEMLAAGGGAWLEAGPGAGVLVLRGGPQASRTASLVAGWNLVTWTGPEGTAAAQAFAAKTFTGEMPPLIAALSFDNASKRFSAYDTLLPAALSDLRALAFGQALWLQMGEAAAWTIPGTGPCGGTDAGVPDPAGIPEADPEVEAVPAADFRFERTPVDLSLVTSVSPPGQLRGNDYKGHGLFRVPSTETTVVMPAAAELYEGSRYIQSGEVQYLLYFRLPSGLVFIFDHVLDPSAQVLAAFEGAPAPPVDDSRTYALIRTSFAAGEVVATAIGFRADGNAFLDFGVYDLTTRNAASASAGFAGDPTGWRDANALCWYAMFGPEAEAAIRAVVATASMESGASDICTD